MKKIFTLCVVLCLSYLTMGASTPKHEFRATWLTTAWGNDWPKTKATSDATRKQQQDSLIAIFDRLQAGNMNAVCLQVRGRSDAFYQSSYEPWAAELAGARGKDPGYDPLAFAIEEAHKRGLELHAWVNPFRVTSAGTLDANDLVKKNAGQWIIQYNNGSFTGEIIDPGYPEAREYVLNVLMEIISNYDIDGIVMDDYFYPYGGTTTEDAASKALHKPANIVDVNQDGDTDDDWRRSNVDVFLKELYDRIQAKKPWVRFGMGTFGIWTTQTKVAQAYGISLPSGISGLDDYDEQACNPVEWVKNGYVDYINPQLYWPTTSTGQNYNKLCHWWAKDVCEHFSNQLTNSKKVHFFSSQSISSNRSLTEIQAQVDANRSNLSSGYTGSVFFDTDAYLTMDKDLMTSRFATHALPPAMDWKSNTALAAPTNLTVSGSTLTWQHATAERFTVYVYPKGTAWSTAKNDPSYLQGVIYGNTMDISGIDTTIHHIAVCAYDRFGVEHEVAIYSDESGTVTPPASGTITYVLNGGMMNEFGWTSKDDMFQACMADCGVTTLPSLDEIKATGNDAALTTICTKLSDVSGMLNSDKWDWLEQYIMDVQKTQAGTLVGAGSVPVLTAGVTSATWRYALAAFFIEGQRTTWPYSADFSQAGKDEAYIPAWKHVYTNPTSVTTEFTLYDPCREGYTFLGWYTNADFSGEKVTTINAETTGTLYAKWINSDWIITYTSTDGNIVTPYKTDVFGANIVSNIYEDGVGTITFDGPVTSIGDYAFYCFRFLTSITIPNSVTSIGDYAFSGCTSLASVVIPESVKSIGAVAFSGCTSLTSVTIPNSVTSIGDSAFSGCTSLTSVVIPESVTSIGDWAFSDCTSLTSIAIPNSVESIGDWAFSGCTSLTSVVIPESVTSIGDWAFSDCTSLTSITIPNSVTSIGDRAFSGCTSLTSIAIPNSVESIGYEAFRMCYSLTSMVVEPGNTTYDSRENCNAIIEKATNTLIAGCQNTIIPNSVTSIGDNAFADCTSLTSVVIPESVTSIGDWAFTYCTSLASVVIPESVTSIGDWAFNDCTSLTSIAIPNSVESIGYEAFRMCYSLTSITIPNSVTSIGDWAFYGCHSLTSITIPESVTSIGYNAFDGCTSLTSITCEATTPPTLGSTVFPSELTTAYIPCGTKAAYEVSDWAQYVSEFIEEGCPKITYELNGGLPNEYGWQNKNDMFQACMADCGVTTLPSLDEIKATGNDAALTTICTKLTDVSGMLNSDKWEWLEQYIMEVQNAQVGNVVGSSFVPAITTTSGAVYWRYALAAFFVDGQRTAWPYSADFSQAGKDEAYIPAWKQVYTYPTSVTSEFTLYDPYRKGYTFLGWYANTDFSGEKVTTINAETTGTLYAKWINNDWIITYTSTDGNIVTPYATDVFGANIVSNTYENGVGTITFDGPVTSIGGFAFDGCSNLASLTIPNSITNIGRAAFQECSSLTSITIPNSVTSIGDFAFGGCSSLTSITIPNSVISIGERAFVRCYSLTAITIPNSVTNIGESAFTWCSSLDFIIVEEGNAIFDSRNNCNAIIETITNTLVQGCSGTTIPNSVINIGDRAFAHCNIISIIIPKNVMSIGYAAFGWCENLETVHIESTTPPILDSTWTFSPYPICYIPCGSLAAYEASAWASQVGEFVEEGCAPVQQCGDNLFWEYADGVLTITGTGDMYDYAADTDVPWYGVRGNIKTINMPDEMTKIGDYAFYKCTALTSVTLPEQLKHIGNRAFAQDTKIAGEVVIPAGVTSIESRAFFNLTGVSQFQVLATTPPTLEDKLVFDYVKAPISVPCGYGLVYRKANIWKDLNLSTCEVLIDNLYYMPVGDNEAHIIGYDNKPAGTLTIPGSVVIGSKTRTVTTLADSLFFDCKEISSVIFNEGLESIGERAFVRCGLTGTIVLPSTLTTIGERAFSYCDNVEKYLIQAMTPPALGANAFTGDNKNALFYISCEAMDDYKVATNWSSLKSRLRDACLNIYHYNTALGANGVYTTEDTLVAGIYYRRQFTPKSWETLYLPFEVDRVTVLEDGVEYDLTAWDIVNGGHYYLAKPYGIENKEVVFGFTQVVDAHTPYIIQFKEPYYHDKMITFHGKESWNKLSSSFEALPISFEMQMAGNTTLQDQILEEPVYMLRATSNFILQNTTTTLHPFECYVMPYASSSSAPTRMTVRLRGDDVTTSVESATGNNPRLTYTIDGNTLTIYPQGQAFCIYSLNGALIYSCEAGKEAVDCELNSGCYLLHAGTEAHKIML